MATKLVECLDWTAPDKPGELLVYAERFKARGVDLDALWAYRSHEDGESKIAAIGKDPKKLETVLKELGVSTRRSRCFHLSGTDGAGVLVDALKALAGAGINVTCADALAGEGKFGAALWVAESDVEKAKKLLKAR